MRLYGYGEDALTLWALTEKLGTILGKLGDDTDPASCVVFYRPSFGRRGGENSSQFGEFDFTILSQERLYLGESKWDGSPLKVEDGVLKLEGNQTRRHEIFKAYVRHWAFGEYRDWEVFRQEAEPLIGRPIPGKNSRLASNLRTILAAIGEYYASEPSTLDVLLYFHHGDEAGQILEEAPGDFKLVRLDYSEAGMEGKYIIIEL
jgi:hypothetical protein